MLPRTFRPLVSARLLASTTLLSAAAFVACAAPKPYGENEEPARVDDATEVEPTPDPATVEPDRMSGQTGEDELPPPPPACEGQTAAYTPVVPRTNVLFVLDRSGSMHSKLPSGGSRWTATRNALFSMLDRLPKLNARADVLLFPQGDPSLAGKCCDVATATCNCTNGEVPAPARRCSASTYFVSAPDDLTPARIGSIKATVNLSNNQYYVGTPLAAALTAAVNAQKGSTNDGLKSIVLLTDGSPEACESAGDPAGNDIARVVEAARLGNSGTERVKTYVLGIMDGTVGPRAEYLSRVAEAGGTARATGCAATQSCFHRVETSTSLTTLTTTLERIARESTDCTFDLPAGTATTNLDAVDVTLTRTGGPQILVRDKTHREGWDLLTGNKQFKLYGESCRALKEDTKAQVQLVVGCKP